MYQRNFRTYKRHVNMQRKGICKNIGICNNANSHKIIIINDDCEPFVCPECGEPLEGLKDGNELIEKTGIKEFKFLYVILGVTAVLIIGLVIWILSPVENTQNDNTITEVTDTVPKEIEGQRSADNMTRIKLDSIRDEEITDSIQLAKRNSALKVKGAEKTGITNTQKGARTQSEESGIHKLSYGTWTGGWKNGKPHGSGTLTYSTSQLIDSRDPKRRMAQPGEYIVGEWDNGRLVQGRWFKKDGSKEAIIIGKAG